MTTLQEQAYAKLNLSLDILGKRSDGYHSLNSIMQQITLADDIEIDVETGEDWQLECDRKGVPTDSRNLAWKAAGVFYKEIGKDPQGITIRIAKRIPMQAGMAGGSADAAAVLRALNRHEKEPFTIWELARLGAKVGSDVPFCVIGHTAKVTGRGESVEPMAPMPRCFYCIAMPNFGVSTPALFEAFDQVENPWHPHTAELERALDQQDLLKVAGYLGNAFEPLVAEARDDIGVMRTVMEDCGALGSSMTGSGPAVFGVFDAFDMAAMASMHLMEKGYRTFLSQNME